MSEEDEEEMKQYTVYWWALIDNGRRIYGHDTFETEEELNEDEIENDGMGACAFSMDPFSERTATWHRRLKVFNERYNTATQCLNFGIRKLVVKDKREKAIDAATHVMKTREF